MSLPSSLAALSFAGLMAHCYSSARLGGDTTVDGEADPAADTTPDLPYECQPPGSFSLDFSISGDTVNPYGAAFDYACTVLRFSADGSPLILELQCEADLGSELITVTVSADPPVYAFFYEGQQVRLNYAAWQPWWLDRWLIIYGTGEGLLLAAVDASALEPYQGEPFATYAPLGVAAVHGVCPPVADVCGPLRRGALDFSLGRFSIRAFDQNDGWLGIEPLYAFVVDEVSAYDAMECYDVPSEWFRFFVANVPVR